MESSSTKGTIDLCNQKSIAIAINHAARLEYVISTSQITQSLQIHLNIYTLFF